MHCIVETISVLEENRYHQGGWRRRPLIDTDTYVIIPVGTPFHNLVQVALFRLGYSSESVAAAKGAVLIKNWKALNFDQICDDPLATVGDILGELSTVATLRIQIFRGKPGIFSDIKDKLLRFLLLQSHGLLISSGCPLDEVSCQCFIYAIAFNPKIFDTFFAQTIRGQSRLISFDILLFSCFSY